MKPSSTNDRPTPVTKDDDLPARAVVELRLSFPAFLVWAFIALAPWLVLLYLWQPACPPSASDTGRRAQLKDQNAAPMEFVQTKSGMLGISPITVDPPSAFFSYSFDANPAKIWHFTNLTRDQISGLFANAGLNAKDSATLMAALKVSPNDPAVLEVEPPESLVAELSPVTRELLYREIAKQPGNPYHTNPFYYFGTDLNDWLGKDDLPAGVVDRVRPLIYRRGTAFLFTDLHLVLPHIQSPITRLKLLRVLCRVSALSLKLQIRQDEAIDPLLAYWGRGGREAEVEPVLTSFRDQDGGGNLDIIYLLPPFARTRLNVYVDPTRANDGVSRDCIWTAFNFFNEAPDNRYGEPTLETMDLMREITIPVQGAYNFGDLLIFLTTDMNIAHACVYIADDIVFTKNGVDFRAPYVFNRLDDLLPLYEGIYGPLQIKHLRLKDKV